MRKVHLKVDNEPTLCGVHHFTDVACIEITTSSDSVTCGKVTLEDLVTGSFKK